MHWGKYGACIGDVWRMRWGKYVACIGVSLAHLREVTTHRVEDDVHSAIHARGGERPFGVGVGGEREGREGDVARGTALRATVQALVCIVYVVHTYSFIHRPASRGIAP